MATNNISANSKNENRRNGNTSIIIMVLFSILTIAITLFVTKFLYAPKKLAYIDSARLMVGFSEANVIEKELKAEDDRALEIWRDKVFDIFFDAGLLDLETIGSMMLWKHSGFNIDTSVRIEADDRAGMQRLIEYISRCPFK